MKYEININPFLYFIVFHRCSLVNWADVNSISGPCGTAWHRKNSVLQTHCVWKCDNRVRNRFKQTSHPLISHTRTFFPSVRFICQCVRLASMENKHQPVVLAEAPPASSYDATSFASKFNMSFRPQITMSRLELVFAFEWSFLVLVVCIVGPLSSCKNALWTDL